MEAADPVVLERQPGVDPQASFHAARQLAAVGGREVGVGHINGWLYSRQRSGQRAPAREIERGGRGGARQVLLEAAGSILLYGVIEEGERVSVMEQAESGAQH